MMRRMLFLAMMLGAVVVPVRGQWGCTVHGGVAMPAFSSGNAPGLRVSLATGLRGGYSFGNWFLTGEVWQVRQLREDNPDLTAVPMDTAFRVKRYQLIPLLLGTGYRFPLSPWSEGTIAVAAGGYFRYINCLKQTSAMTLSDMGESGWGFAGKVSAEVRLWKRVNLSVWFMTMGNPFEEVGETIPGSKASEVTFNRSHWQLEGFGQSFWGICLGYSF